MLGDIKTIIGIGLIIVSFIYILSKPGVSMVDALMQQRKKKAELLKAQMAEEERLASLESEKAASTSQTEEQDSED